MKLALVTVAFSGWISIGIGIFTNMELLSPLLVVPTCKKGSAKLLVVGTSESTIAVSMNCNTSLLEIALL